VRDKLCLLASLPLRPARPPPVFCIKPGLRKDGWPVTDRCHDCRILFLAFRGAYPKIQGPRLRGGSVGNLLLTQYSSIPLGSAWMYRFWGIEPRRRHRKATNHCPLPHLAYLKQTASVQMSTQAHLGCIGRRRRNTQVFNRMLANVPETCKDCASSPPPYPGALYHTNEINLLGSRKLHSIFRLTFPLSASHVSIIDGVKDLNRVIFLETVAGIPGMVAGTLRHLTSLRRMRRWVTIQGYKIKIHK